MVSHGRAATRCLRLRGPGPRCTGDGAWTAPVAPAPDARLCLVRGSGGGVSAIAPPSGPRSPNGGWGVARRHSLPPPPPSQRSCGWGIPASSHGDRPPLQWL